MTTRKQSWKIIARRVLGKDATYYGGDGPIAFVTPWREVHYPLWPNREEASKRKCFVDRTGCGGECNPRSYYIVDLLNVPVSDK